MDRWIESIQNNPVLIKLIAILLGGLLILLFITLLKRSLGRYIRAENWYKTKKAINIFGYLRVLLLLGTVYSDRLGGITVALGVASAGIAFALQEVITSVAGWMAILVGGFYKAGDRVMVGGIRGDVIDLGVLRTTVMELGEWVDGDLYNGRIVRIANSFVFKEPVFNYSADFPFLWDEIKIPVRYGSDYRLAKELITETGEAIIGDFVTEAQMHWDVMVRKYMIENASTGIMVTLVATDNWVEFTLRYVVDYQRRRSIKNELFLQILDAVDRTEGQVKLASATHEITDLPPIDVMMR